MSTIELTTKNLSITVKGESNDSFYQDIYINAITILIEQADMSGSIKEHENFNIAVLKALIRNNAIEWDYPDKLLYKDVLLQIIDDLKDNPQLNENIVLSDEEYSIFFGGE